MDHRAECIFEVMVERGMIPSSDIFEITEELLEQSTILYREIFPPLRVKAQKTSEKRLSKKIAGFNMMLLNQQRFEASQQDAAIKLTPKLKQKCGFVYVISNPAFEDIYKVGMTTNLKSRLSTYQTYDPHRRFKVENYVFVMDRRATEKFVLESFKVDLVGGEWISNSKVTELVKGLM